MPGPPTPSGFDPSREAVTVLSTGQPGPADHQPARRLALRQVSVRTERHRVEVRVSLADGHCHLSGAAYGPGSGSHPLRLAADATLEALDPELGTRADVEHVAVLHLGPHQVALALVALLGDRGREQTVSGSALVRADQTEAVARAVLDALNRHVDGASRRTSEV